MASWTIRSRLMGDRIAGLLWRRRKVAGKGQLTLFSTDIRHWERIHLPINCFVAPMIGR